MDLSEMDVADLVDSVPSETKWTYVTDFRNRRAVFDDAGRPEKTKTYAEYLTQTALKILNTERFQYVIYTGNMGVERSEWPGWEDAEISRDIEEALTAHPEIERAEVVSMERRGQEMSLTIRIEGTAGSTTLEEVIPL
ncbi:DUF2634 domain-containing protein [Paenibacillus lacisoli]|uniref:DUF2634 domain-containing protein n=1 Tax=Paenibacillus lacisoli TaxID=3064525 RepID=UPI00272AE41B|nr:DUF2634 domain-containing protein [Paenibacillus sp. JX-17]